MEPRFPSKRSARRAGVVLLFVAMVSTGWRIWAHRVDECLQTTFVTIGSEWMELEVLLTPGIQVAPSMLDGVDRDHDGEVSVKEGAAYAEQVRRELRLVVDEIPRDLSVSDVRFPSLGELKEGVGIIRIRLRAPAPGLAPGSHRFGYVNAFQTNGSVYLVNALVPSDAQVRLGRQTRDTLQRSTEIGFELLPAPAGKGAGPTSPNQPGL